MRFTLLLLFIHSYSFASYSPFSKINFAEGGYALTGLFSESSPSKLRDQLGEFYVDDIAILQAVKKQWVFKKESPFYACGYHYDIYLTKNGYVIDDFSVNIECKMITTSKGFYFFDESLLKMLIGKTKTPQKKRHQFATCTEGREFIKKCYSDSALLMIKEPYWIKYDGKFRCEFTDSNPKNSIDEVENRLRSEINKRIPNQEFVLVHRSSTSSGNHEFEIICKKQLYDYFNFYHISKNWEDFEAICRTYWKE